jgi:plastocyanin
MRTLALIALAVSLAAATAVSAAAATRVVRVGDNWFVRPSGVPTVTVARGTTVTWRYVGREPHNVAVQRGPERFRAPIRRRGTYSRTMRLRGTYTIICDLHGARDQRMRLVVR